MYSITIVTKYNTINLTVEDYNSPAVIEILEQPWVVSVDIKKTDEKGNVKVRKRRLDDGT